MTLDLWFLKLIRIYLPTMVTFLYSRILCSTVPFTVMEVAIAILKDISQTVSTKTMDLQVPLLEHRAVQHGNRPTCPPDLDAKLN